jgi:hypothetical protein
VGAKYAKFRNDRGVPEIVIGTKKFKCIGVSVNILAGSRVLSAVGTCPPQSLGVTRTRNYPMCENVARAVVDARLIRVKPH